MASAESSTRLRVAVLGATGAAADWALAGRGIEVKVVGDLASLLGPDVDLGFVFGDALEGVEIARAAAAQPGSPPLVLLVGSDAGDHPHARFLKVLLDAKNEWERTFDAILDPVALIDPSGHVERANRALARALERPIEGTIGVGYLELLGPAIPVASDVAAADPIAGSLADGRPRTKEARYTHLDAIHEVTTSPLLGPDGTSRGLVVILKDASERKEQQERLLRASRLAAIGQLAAGVAHEINTPLASIALRAEALLKASQEQPLVGIEAFEKFPRYLKTIDEEIFRCKKIIGSLLDFSRVRKPEVRSVDLNALAEKAADLVNHQMRLKQVTLEVRLDPDLPPIVADDGQLRQALLALLMNALDATASGGRVVIETSREGDDNIGLTVADTGTGIPAEHRDKIFSPFFTTKPVGRGTGLGLAICHGIVASHGGEIRVDTEAEKGTRVTLVLPGPKRPVSLEAPPVR